MIDHLKVVENLKLWAAFAQLGMEDPPTAAAALGCLAMAVRDPEVRNHRATVASSIPDNRKCPTTTPPLLLCRCAAVPDEGVR